MELVIRKSRKKAVAITVAGFLAGIAGGLILHYVHDVVLGWCFVITAGLTLLYGIGSLADRRPYLILTERGITDQFTVREEIVWEAILRADDFFYRGQYWVRLLLSRNYKPQIGTTGFRRFDRIYGAQGLRPVYLRMMGLEIDSMQLVALIRRIQQADPAERSALLAEAPFAGRRPTHPTRQPAKKGRP